MKLGLGTVQFGLDYGISNKQGKSSKEEVVKILNTAAQRDIKILDSAPAYGDSENVLGECLIDNQKFNIVTKTPHFSTHDIKQELLTSFTKSLADLRTNSVYGLLIHRADDLLSEQGDLLWNTMQELKQQSKVKKIGVSVYTVAQTERILAKYAIDIIQLPINVFNQKFLVSGMLKNLKKTNIEIHARSVFLQGLLLMQPQLIPVNMTKAKEHVSTFQNDCKNNGCSCLQAALNFVLRQKEIDIALLGVCSQTELQEIIEAINSPVATIDYSKYVLNDECILNPSLWNN